MNTKTLTVDGMSCGGCEETVENALGALEGVTRVDADHEAGSVDVVVEDGVDEGNLRTAIHDAGYEVTA